MASFIVNDMTCGHCVGTITQALNAMDPDASVAIDLAQHRVQVESAIVGADGIRAVIEQAGYSPEAVVPADPA